MARKVMTPAQAARTKKSARETLWMLALLAVIIAGGVWYINWRNARDEADEAAAEKPPGQPGVPAAAQPVTVGFARDGDTVEVRAAVAGDFIDSTETVIIRVLGIDAPETHGGPDGGPQCWATEAFTALKQYAPPGATLWVLGDKETFDPYGRYLAWIWTADGTFVNQQLAELGDARFLYIPPNNRYYDEISDAVKEAQSAKRGLWGTCSG